MKEKIFNFILAFLFSLTFIFTVFSLTILNEKYIFKLLDKDNYYEKITDEINTSLKNEEIDYSFDVKTVKRDLNEYIKKRYVYKKIDIADEKIEKIYNRFILFAGKNDYRKYSYVIYFITVVIIIITGNVFLKSKKNHDLNKVFIISFIFLLSFYAFIYFFINVENDLINTILMKTNYIILASSIIFLEIGVYKTIKIKIFS